MTALTAFRVGGWAWLVTGIGHLTLSVVGVLRPEDPAATRAVAAARDVIVPIPGIRHSLHDVNLGSALVLGVAMILVGLLCLLAARSAPELVARTRALSGILTVASLVAFGLSAWLLPVPPIATFAVATLAFGRTLAAVSRPCRRLGPVLLGRRRQRPTPAAGPSRGAGSGG